jgi:hypothetical protein
MTDKLVQRGAVTSPAVEPGFRIVPRHAFALLGTPLEECCHGSVVRTKKAPTASRCRTLAPA